MKWPEIDVGRNRERGPVIINRVGLGAAVWLVVLLAFTGCGPSREAPPPPPEGPAAQRTGRQIATLDDNPRFDQLGLEEGLSQSTVNAILQDYQGFMWLGTADGLNRYDGYTFTIFRHAAGDPQSLSNNHITAIYEDRSGTLWIGTEGGGLNQFDRKSERFNHHQNDPGDPYSLSNDSVKAIFEDGEGYLWVATATGLNRFDPASGQFTLFPNNADPDGKGYENNQITAVNQEELGNLWVGTVGGLYTFDPVAGTYRALTLDPDNDVQPGVSVIYQDSVGRFWVGTFGSGLFGPDPTLEERDEGFIRYQNEPGDPRSLSNDFVHAIQEDQDGQLWIGTEEGLSRLDPASNLFRTVHADPALSDSLSNDVVYSIFIDEAGVFWVGTANGGINLSDPYGSKFGHVRSLPSNPAGGLSHNMVRGFHEEKYGGLWIATENGLNWWDPLTRKFNHYFHDPNNPASISSNTVTSVTKDRSKSLWVGTIAGINKFDPETEHFEIYTHDPSDPNSLSSDQVNVVYGDSGGNLWVGTAGGGLDKMDPAREGFIHYQYQDEGRPIDTLSRNHITTLLEDKGGQLWIGSRGGLAKLDPDKEVLTYYAHDPTDPQSLSDNVINAIYEDASGVLWLGTGEGLNRFDPDTGVFSHYRVEDGLPNNSVMGILGDATGMLWLSTNRGLSRFDPESNSFKNYDTSDGLQALEFNGGAYYKSTFGELLFGGINGYNSIRPANVVDNPYVAPVVITDFRIQNESIIPGPDSPLQDSILQSDSIKLDRQDTVFSFELAALHYGGPEDNQYAYIMEGFDEDWNYIGNRRNATYTNLPPGNYTFRAIGTNSDGVWNNDGVSLNVTVPYPYWRSWWFVALVALALSVTLFGSVRLRNRSAMARTRELEEQVAERTSEIEQRRQIAEGLREILIILNTDQSLEESLHYIVSQAARLTEAEDAIIFRRDEENRMTILATNPGGQIRYSPGTALVTMTEEWRGRELIEKKPMIVPNMGDYWSVHPQIRPHIIEAHQALLGIPLFLGEEIYGGLIMFYTEERTFSEEDLELGFTFADQAALAIANDRLREQAKLTAVATERSRLARDLHDAVTQTLFSASLIAETLPSIWEGDQQEGRELLGELRQLTRGALAEMRTLLLELRPSALEEASLPELVRQLAEAVTGRTGVPVTITVEGTSNLSTNTRVALYRITQESLNNVMKHARATQVEISLIGCQEQNGLTLIVRDNGRGFDPKQKSSHHHGLEIISERSQAIGATLLIDSEPGKGTTVTVEWKENEQLSDSGNE